MRTPYCTGNTSTSGVVWAQYPMPEVSHKGIVLRGLNFFLHNAVKPTLNLILVSHSEQREHIEKSTSPFSLCHDLGEGGCDLVTASSSL